MAHVLIAGKEFPDGAAFARAAKKCGRNVSLTAFQSETGYAENFHITEWHKGSPVSAHAAVIGAETHCGCVDEAVLFFDAAWYAERCQPFGTQDCSRFLDDAIAGFMYMTLELLARFSRKGRGTLVYLFKKDASQTAPKGIMAEASQAAFRALAEGVYREFDGKNSTRVLLARETGGRSDEEFARWLFPDIDGCARVWNAEAETRGSQKSGSPFFKKNAQNAVKWILCGAKPASGFALFKKFG
jgi:NADP-dependent 3-hydroxy acid dehydrogenase YdfG